MKIYTVITAYLLVCALAICQVFAVEHEEQMTVAPEAGVCAVETNVNRVLHNYMMAVCNNMQPGSMRNMNMQETLNIPTSLIHSIMMMPNIIETATGQRLKARDLNEDSAHPAQIFAPFPPFPPFPPYPPFRPVPVAPVTPVAPVGPVGSIGPIGPIAPVSPAPPRVLPPIAAPPAEAPTVWIQPIWTPPTSWASPIFPPFPPFPPYPPSY